MNNDSISELDLSTITGGVGQAPPPPRPAPKSADGAICRAGGWGYYTALGAALGSFGGPVGTVIGAGAGAVVGSLATEGCPP